MAVRTTHLSDFLPLVLPHAPGCPIPVATFNLRVAAIEFCEKTRCWRNVSKQTVSRQNATVIAPQYAAIHQIEYAYFNGEKLTPTQFSDIDQSDASALVGDAPSYITQVTPNTVAVYPFAVGELSLSTFLKPRGGNEFGQNEENPIEDAYDFVPDFMLIQHGEPIAFGALARILAIPQQPYTNVDMAMHYLGRFREAMDGLFSSNMKGQQRAPRRTKFNDF